MVFWGENSKFWKSQKVASFLQNAYQKISFLKNVSVYFICELFWRKIGKVSILEKLDLWREIILWKKSLWSSKKVSSTKLEDEKKPVVARLVFNQFDGNLFWALNNQLKFECWFASLLLIHAVYVKVFLQFSVNFDSLLTSRQNDDHFLLNFAETTEFTPPDIRMFFDFFAPFPAELLKIIFFGVFPNATALDYFRSILFSFQVQADDLYFLWETVWLGRSKLLSAFWKVLNHSVGKISLRSGFKIFRFFRYHWVCFTISKTKCEF